MYIRRFDKQYGYGDGKFATVLNFMVFSLVFIITINCSVKDKFTFFPDRITELPESSIPDFALEKWVRTPDGETIQCFLFQHDPYSKKQLIIYFHGNAGNLYSRFDTAVRLFEMDYDILLVSYRGYAKSSGTPTEEGIYLDGKSAIDYAINELGYTEGDIAVFGRSLGSTVAVQVSQKRPFKCVVLITPFTSGKDMAIAMGLGLFKFVAGNSYNSLARINNLETRLLIVHGDQDEVVPYKMGQALFEAYQGPKKLVTINGGRHNDLQLVQPILYWSEIEKFLLGEE